MSYCKKCGAYIPDADDICPACGESVNEAPPQASAKAEEKRSTGYGEFRASGEYHSGAYQQAEPQSGEYRSDAYVNGEYRGEYYSGYAPVGSDSQRYSREFDADAHENRGMGFLCYLGILFLIPYFTRPDSQFLRYHCNQGLVLLLFCILASVCTSLPILGWIGGTAGYFFAFYCLIKGLVNVSKGKRSPLPIIGQITIIK